MNRARRRHTASKLLRLEQLETRQLLTINAAFVADDLGLAHDQPTARIVNGSRTDAFPSVGIVNGYCSGTLISPTHVLTAAHCTVGVSPDEGYFDVEGEIYQTSSIYIHPRYNDRDFAAGYDISILELQNSIDDVDPSEINRVAPAVGQQLTLVGFGQTGTSREGSNFDFGTKHIGMTEIEGVRRLHLDWNFDSHEESNTAFGDSGGPAFIEVDGEYVVAGVTSGGSLDPFQLGGNSFDTRVDVLAGWVDGVVEGSATADDFVNQPGPGVDQLYLNQRGDATITGTIQELGDRDVFRVQVGIATTLRVSLGDRSFEGTFDPYLEVFDGDGTLIASDDDGGFGLSSRVALEVEAGTYFISAGSFLDGKLGSYELEVNTDIRDDRFLTELLDFQQATTAIEQGIIEVSEDIDRFELRIDQPSSVDISLAASDRLDPQLRLYDQDGNLVAENDNETEETRNSRLVLDLEQGIYEIAASAFETNSVGSYQLSVTRDLNEIPAIALDHFGAATIEGHLPKGAQRQFRLNVGQASLATISVQGASAKFDTKLTLLNEAGDMVAENDDFDGTVGSRLELLLDAGDYLVVIESYDNQQSGDYVLQASLSYEGDADGDGTVGFRDFLILSQNFTGKLESPGGKTFRQGDFSGDGDVDFDDFLRLINNWNLAETTDHVFAAWPAGQVMGHV